MQIYTTHGLQVLFKHGENTTVYSEFKDTIERLSSKFIAYAKSYGCNYATGFARIGYNQFITCTVTNQNTYEKDKMADYIANWAICRAGRSSGITQELSMSDVHEIDEKCLVVLEENFHKIVHGTLICHEPIDSMCRISFMKQSYRMEEKANDGKQAEVRGEDNGEEDYEC